MWRALQAWVGKHTRLAKAVEALARAHRQTTGFVSVAPTRAPRQRWSVGDEGKLEALKDLVSSAERLDALMASPGWKDVLDAKGFYQSLADRQTKNVTLREAQRFQAACEWSAIEGFFMELHQRIRRGRKAKEVLGKLVKTR